MDPHKETDRSRDRSQPLENLGPDETLKAESNYLRGTIEQSLADEITAGVTETDNKLLKFHGMYQQDDRDIRDERRRQKLEPEYTFMVRLRLPGGVVSPAQWLVIDDLARRFGRDSLRLTTRQTFQYHYVDRGNLQTMLQDLRDVLIDTKAACGDDSRGVMSTVNPNLSAVHRQVYELAAEASDHAVHKTTGYEEIWYREERPAGEKKAPLKQVQSGDSEEPFYGKTYMPRKFKIGFAVPPSNDIDVYSQDLGFIAVAENGKLQGFNVAVGGGMGRTDRAPETYPRLADVIGYVEAGQVIPVIDAVMSVQRDFGDRVNRAHARFKYTVDDKGVDWIKEEIEHRLGFDLGEVVPYEFATNGDPLGWTTGEDGLEHCTLFIENGRLTNQPDKPLLDGMRALAEIHKGTFLCTPNQNVIVADVAPEDRPAIEAVMEEFGLGEFEDASALRLNSMACVAFPTCALAMAESERYLPELVTRIDTILEDHGLRDEPITIRMTGCPNGCARPYIAEIALTGRAPGKYNLYLGGGFHGQRLNKMLLENVGEEAILEALGDAIGRFASEREEGERFGDFVIRAGIVPEVTEGRFFND